MDSLRRRVAERLAVATSPTSSTPYSESNLRQYWMPDNVSVECYECSARFTTFRRKHHCRVCGQIFCSKCCNIFISGHYLKITGTLRICAFCYKKFSQQHQSADGDGGSINGDAVSSTSGLSVSDTSSSGQLSVSPSASFLERRLPQRLSNLMTGNSNASTGNSSIKISSEPSPSLSAASMTQTTSSSALNASTVRKKSSALIRPNFLTMEDEVEGENGNFVRREACTPDPTEAEETEVQRPEINLKDPQKLEKLWEQIVSSSGGIPLETKRFGLKLYAGCFSGSDIIDWLQARDSTIWRSQALAVGQALLDAGYLEDLTQVVAGAGAAGVVASSVTQLNATFDEKIPYRPIIRDQMMPRLPSGDDEADVINFSTNGIRDNIFDADGPEWLQQVEFPMEGNDYEPEGEWKPRMPKMSTTTNWGPVMPEFDRVGVSAASAATSPAVHADIDCSSIPALDTIYHQHVEDYLDRLMRRERLSSKWTELIRSFCQKIVANIELDAVVDPDLKRVNMDIRDFVKIKRIPGGLMDDCTIVKGEVFSNRVIRVGMPLSLDNTNILLIKDSIAYAREDRYVSLANMKLQEEEFTKNICHKIKSFKPRLILVERSMCRSAQDILCEANIAVVLNVKGKILKRVSRFFGTPIVESLAFMVDRPTLGACDRYRSRMYGDISEGEPKNLISLEGRELKNGCTILLRGGCADELAKVKRIIRRILLVKMHCKYERSFLLHEDVQTEEFFERRRSKFHEMTLSPFVTMPCEDMEVLNENITDTSIIEAVKEFGDSDDEDESSQDGNQTETETLLNDSSDIENGNSTVTSQPRRFSHQLKNCLQPMSEFEKHIFVTGMDDVLTRNMLSKYRAECSRRARNVKPKPVNPSPVCQVPTYYKALETKCTPMLFGSHAPTTVDYCVPPWVVKMSYYYQNDIPLGVFLDSFCFHDNYKCPSKKSCSVAMRDHIRRFCLGDASVTLVLQEIDAPVVAADTTNIFMWKFCNECKNMSTILPLSYNSWMLSFSMFLLLCLNETQLVRKTGIDGSCPHSIHRDQYTCFARGDLVAFFKVSPIIYSSIIFPPREIVMPPLSIANDRLLADLEDLSVKGSNLFSQINAKVVKLKAGAGGLESFVSELLLEEEEDFAEYRKRVDLIRDKLRLVDASALHETQCSVATLASWVHSACVKWEAKLAQFNELRKKEEKSGKADPKQRISSGSASSVSTAVTSSSGPSSATLVSSVSVDKSSVTMTSSIPLGTSVPSSALPSSSSVFNDDSVSTTSRIWQSMLPSGSTENQQLTSPFAPTLHPALCLPVRAVMVDEAQLSSIVAHALAKPEYHEFLATRAKSESDNTSGSEISLSGGVTSSAGGDGQQPHFKTQFSDESCKFYVCVHFAYEFARLRERILVRDEETIDFIASMAECKKWSSSGGKSGMTFFKTLDERFIIKQLQMTERNSFPDFAPLYFKYINDSQESGQPSLLAKIFGVYTVGYKNSVTSASLKIDFLVIENLFYKRNIHESYDLKGSVRNRFARAAGDKSDDQVEIQVLMDENLLKVARERPFYIRKNKNPEFYSAIHRDTNFLKKTGMMDYSLLVGIDADNDDLVLGIIDYIRKFTWDKKIEMIVKSSGILGYRGKQPTCIPPELYRARFIEAMDKYFIQVPNYWYQFGGSDAKED